MKHFYIIIKLNNGVTYIAIIIEFTNAQLLVLSSAVLQLDAIAMTLLAKTIYCFEWYCCNDDGGG